MGRIPDLFGTFWLSQWSRYITDGNSNPGYPLLFQGDSPLFWIHRLREAFSKNKNHFWLPLLRVYWTSIMIALFLKLAFLFSCGLCSIVFTKVISMRDNLGALNSALLLLLAYLFRSVMDAHARLYLARVTIRLDSGLTGVIFYRLLSRHGTGDSRPELKLGPGSGPFLEPQRDVNMEGPDFYDPEKNEKASSERMKGFRSLRGSDFPSTIEAQGKITCAKSLEYLLSEPDVFSMLVGDISTLQLFMNSLIDCILLPINIWMTWKLLSKQVGFVAAIPGITTFLIFFISSFAFQVLGTIYKAPFLEFRDQRLSVCHDILGTLRVIRIMGAEDLAFEKIMKSRNVESAMNRKRLVKIQFGSFLEYHAQRATQLIVFLIFHIFIGTSLNLSAALASIHILHSLASPLRGIPVTFIEGLISLLRIRTFFSSHPDGFCEYLREEDDDASTNCEFSGPIDFSNSKRGNGDYSCICNGSGVMCIRSFCGPSLNVTSNGALECKNSLITDCQGIIQSHLCGSEDSLRAAGKCVVITGSTGSGNTSIINSILQHKENDLCYAYSSQNSWIPQGTVRSAILFGKPWDEDLYNLVTDICQLQLDFSTWKDGDLRVIDEGGSSLSGGQRTRVALARCLYYQNEASLFLLDDIFLNLDPNVGSKIFSRLFGPLGFLNRPHSKTLLSIDLTSLLYYLNQTSNDLPTMNIHIVHLNNNGIFFSGALPDYQQLISSRNVPTSQSLPSPAHSQMCMHDYAHVSTPDRQMAPNCSNGLCKENQHKAEEELEVIHRINHQLSALQSENISFESLHSIIGATPTSSGTCVSPSTLSLSLSTRHKEKSFYKPAQLPEDLILETEINTGRRNTLQIYFRYFALVGRTWCATLLASCMLKSLFDRYSDTFISYNDSTNNPNFILVYTFIVLFQGALCGLLFVGEAIGGIKASDLAHNSFLKQILFAPNWLSDSTPTSYLLNRLGTDMLVMDESPLKKIASVIVPSVDFLIQISILSFAVPLSLPITLLVTYVTYKTVCRKYISTYIRAQRVALSVLSPMYGLFSQVINGILVIRAFNAQKHLLSQFLTQIEHLQRIRLLQHVASQWTAIRLQIYTLPLVVFICLVPVESNWRYLALLYSLLISDTTSVITYRFASMERDMCSCERIFMLISNEQDFGPGNAGAAYTNAATTIVIPTAHTAAAEVSSSFAPERKGKTPRVLGLSSFDSIENEQINDGVLFVIDYNYEKKRQLRVIPEDQNLERGLPSLGKLFVPGSQRTGVRIVDLEVGYSDFLGTSNNTVLEGLNMSAGPSEQVGIVGRTGSGKSTLILALLGLTKYNKGQIFLDETPISTLSIKDRRKFIGVLPQTPLILKDWTIRDFLDPYNEFSDEEIFRGLDECLLQEFKGNLYAHAGSLSESHLRYLSIAKLVISSKHYRMILIDEPPPNINGDQGLQQSISRILTKHFKHCNIFIVAHHVESIKDCNNVWILAQRRIVKSIHPRVIPTQNELAQILTNFE
ncbi:ABC transporter family protein [Cryptosporidium felis]|nr:ABC transporter family protein [Cryptosporidium felis]